MNKYKSSQNAFKAREGSNLLQILTMYLMDGFSDSALTTRKVKFKTSKPLNLIDADEDVGKVLLLASVQLAESGLQ